VPGLTKSHLLVINITVKRTIFPSLLVKITIFNTIGSQNHILHTYNSKKSIFSTPLPIKITIICLFASKIHLYLNIPTGKLDIQ